MNKGKKTDRRGFLKVAAATGSSVLVAGYIGIARGADDEEIKGEQVTPPEDLMQEHGLLKRVMLVYDEIARRIVAKEDFDPGTLADSADVIRKFVEDYHEKQEEDFVFPRFRKANLLVDLVDVLKQQHDAGRKVTTEIMQRATTGALKDKNERRKVVEAIRQFNRMYAPHEAREDTVLFPALRKVVSGNEFDAMGEDFEKREHAAFGANGFEKMVERVAGTERKLGIYELRQFTPMF